MAFKRYGAQKSNSRYGAAKKSYGSNKRSSYKKEKKENDPMKPFIILKPFEPEEDEGKRYPDLTGFVNFSPEFIELLTELPINEEYGTVQGITVAVWEQPDGSLMGSLSHYVPDDEEEDEPAPKKKAAATRTKAKASTTKTGTRKSSTKKTAPPPEEEDEESDDELDDLPF